MPAMAIAILDADFADPTHREGIVTVLCSYAADPMGGGAPLAADVQARLVGGLEAHPTTLVLLAFDGPTPVGVAVCFVGFSTFAARPLLNVHDLAVLPEYRGRRIGRALLAAAEERARTRGCCKLTLEVLDDNRRARALYDRFGFRDVALGASAFTRFVAKPLTQL